MRSDLPRQLGESLRRARKDRGLTQPALAARIGRTQARISELEKDLLNGRLGKDRLTLLMEICDALDLTPVLMPRHDAKRLFLTPEHSPHGQPFGSSQTGPSRFDEVFVDLSEEGEEDHG